MCSAGGLFRLSLGTMIPQQIILRFYQDGRLQSRGPSDFHLAAETQHSPNEFNVAKNTLRVVPSPTGLPSKRGPGLGSFSRADRGIGGVRHVAPPTWLVSNFLVSPASS